MVRKSKGKGAKQKPVNLRFPPAKLRFPIGSIVNATIETATAGRIVDTVMKLESLGSTLYYRIDYDNGVEAELTHEQLIPLVPVEGPKSPNENVKHNDGKQAPESPNENINQNEKEPPPKSPNDVTVPPKPMTSSPKAYDVGPIRLSGKEGSPKVDDDDCDDDEPTPPKSEAGSPKVVDDSDDDGPLWPKRNAGKRKIVSSNLSDNKKEWDEQCGSDDLPGMQSKRPFTRKEPSTAKKPKPTAVASSNKKKGVQVTLLRNKVARAANAAPKRNREAKLKSNDDGEAYSASDYNKKPYSAGDGLRVISEPQLMFDDMVQEQLFKKLQGITCSSRSLKRCRADLCVWPPCVLARNLVSMLCVCCGLLLVTDTSHYLFVRTAILALDMIQQSLRDLVAKNDPFGNLDPAQVFPLQHIFSCEIEPFKQGYIERNFSPPLLFRDIRELGNDQAHTAYGRLADVPNKPGCVDILIAGTSCVDYSNLNTKKVLSTCFCPPINSSIRQSFTQLSCFYLFAEKN